MEQSKAIERIEEILNESKIGVLSTAKDNVPNARYMWFYNDGLTLYAKTNDQSPKYDELGENPQAHVLLGFNDTDNNAFVEINGNVERINDQQTIDWLWEKQDKSFFDSKENPHLKVLKITPDAIKIMNDDEEPVEITL